MMGLLLLWYLFFCVITYILKGKSMKEKIFIVNICFIFLFDWVFEIFILSQGFKPTFFFNTCLMKYLPLSKDCFILITIAFGNENIWWYFMRLTHQSTFSLPYLQLEPQVLLAEERIETPLYQTTRKMVNISWRVVPLALVISGQGLGER